MINHNKSIRNNLQQQLEWFNNNNNNGRVKKLKRKRNETIEFATREYLNEHCSSSQNDWNKLSIDRSWGSHIDIGTTKITKQPEREFGVKKNHIRQIPHHFVKITIPIHVIPTIILMRIHHQITMYPIIITMRIRTIHGTIHHHHIIHKIDGINKTNQIVVEKEVDDIQDLNDQQPNKRRRVISNNDNYNQNRNRNQNHNNDNNGFQTRSRINNNPPYNQQRGPDDDDRDFDIDRAINSNNLWN